ncbi:MAG: acyclic terpene utilization AtuA family protein [Pseudomonadota bacterium]
MRIGGASGYWGESAMATPQLLAAGVDVLVYDYLAEITMSLLARAKAKDPEAGFATDFITAAMKPHLAEIAASGTKVISNAGGVNPVACAAALRALIAKAGLSLRVAVVTGDDLMPKAAEVAGADHREMFSGESFPAVDRLASMNAYLGAFPIAKALRQGADIVVTGRCVDSAVTLGALIAHYGWGAQDWDLLAAGSLVGHVLECGPQATGGNFTDWRDVTNRAEIGYPIAEVAADGSAVITKPEGSGGLVSVGTVSEQIVYEIGDPGAYLLPDVTCDFRDIKVEAIDDDRVRVSGAKGRAAPPTYKVCATYADGWRAGITPTFYGFDAVDKARAFASDVIARTEARLRSANLPPLTETSVEVIGGGSLLGREQTTDEVVVKLAARHPDAIGVGVLLKEAAGIGLASAPGLSGFAGARPKPSPVVRLFSFLLPKDEVAVDLDIGDGPTPFAVPDSTSGQHDAQEALINDPPQTDDTMIDVPLIKAAWARSGDKGASANVGVIARHPDLLPYLWEQLTEEAVAERFAHILEGRVQRFAMPGLSAINFLLTESLGGGGIASLRADAQGKGFSQVILTMPVRVPERLITP